MECGEMQRNVWAQVQQNPVSELSRFFRVVVQRGNHQVRNFKPHGRFIFQPLESFQDWREVRQRGFAVEGFGEGFQVDVGCVDVVVDVVESFVGDVAVGDHDGFQAVLFRGLADIDDVLAPNGGLVVGEGDGVAAVLQGEQRNVLWGHLLRVHLVLMGLGDIPVLAEEAAHVASGGAHAENTRARQEMVQRFFFDGVNLKSGEGAVAEAEEFAALIDADEAEASLAGAQMAVTGAEVAVNSIVGLGLPPEGFVQGFGFLEDL
jgi:hypothetical protein